MASRTGSGMSAPKKIMTYGKQTRKRYPHGSGSIRPTEDQESIASRTDIVKESPAKPPASTSLTHRAPRNKPTESAGLGLKPGLKSGPNAEIISEPKDTTQSKKRKRAHPPNVEADPHSHAHSGSPSSRPLSQASPTTEVRKSPASRSKPTSSTASPRPLARPSKVRPVPRAKLSPSPDVERRNLEQTSPQVRRPRLIDTLAAQRNDSSDSENSTDEDEEEEEDESTPVFSSGLATPSQQSSQQNSQQHSQPRPTVRPGVVLQGKRVKYTYGQARTILSEPSTSGLGSHEDDLDALLSPPPGPINDDPFAFGNDDSEEDGDLRPAIKSVHELRRAGANNRFADEMEDLLVRIGAPNHSPASQRRGGLLELAQKLQRKDFLTQFRDHATRDKVFKKLGEEDDLVNGFALAAVLVQFLEFSPTTHLLRQIVDDGLWRLLSRLLRIDEDISTLAVPKLSGSKTSRMALQEVKKCLMGMRIWHGRRLTQLSPQTLALQLLKVLCQQTDPGYSVRVVRDLEGDLMTIIDKYSEQTQTGDVDFHLVITILETQSSLTLDGDDEYSWIFRISPKVSQFLSHTLEKWPHGPEDVQSTVLKLAINTTNTAQGASAFNDEPLLSKLSKCICTGFRSTQDAVINQKLRRETYDSFLLVLGVMINILEHCPPARESVDGESLENLMSLYLEHQASASEADSVEKSQLSVAFGYLAVLLGYLASVTSVRTRLITGTAGEGLSGLIGSIQEFINLYRSVDNRVQELEGLVRELRRANF